jgi:hypothetical protein
MKKLVTLICIAVLLASTAAFAEDGFKAYLGYSLGYQETRGSFYSDSAIVERSTTTGLTHGPSVDVRYEGPIFVRGTFDYLMGASNKTKMSDDTGDNTKYSATLSNWTTEADLGVRVLNTSGFGISPYVGIGYIYNKTKITFPSGPMQSTYTSPYAAIGGLFKYENPQWSAGLDVAALVAFAGSTKLSVATSGMTADGTFKSQYGYGARVQVPLTYTVIEKKSSGVGIMVFATPYFQYLDTFKSTMLSNADFTSAQMKFSNTLYGIKTGVGFAF